MVYEFGVRVVGLTQPVTGEIPLIAGKMYQVDVQAREGIIDPATVASFLTSKMAEKYPEIEVTWMKICERYQTIQFQFTTVPLEARGLTPKVQPLVIVELLTWLPLILTLIGITSIAISAWNILAGVPWYVWALLGMGIVLLIFGPSIARAVTREVPERYRPPIIVTR